MNKGKITAELVDRVERRVAAMRAAGVLDGGYRLADVEKVLRYVVFTYRDGMGNAISWTMDGSGWAWCQESRKEGGARRFRPELDFRP